MKIKKAIRLDLTILPKDLKKVKKLIDANRKLFVKTWYHETKCEMI